MTSSRKVARDAESCGRETDVTRGMQRKCVGRGADGLGGIAKYFYVFGGGSGQVFLG